ncbi:MAG TPA: glycoside hydrolase family 2 TIM barrel-domain containing protein [Dysgonamonadaceae bacterium]|nr:glycoside hydrolase family 2 TIM barrel-domain containing protein [Dysgonamonadaceae bacterium]HQG07962.1 glycoside hydrolase family 2 TIM barrel-domain containing protein [Dysgonamonadaceae bacterium]HQI43321.1 glycoside hydrolase family 2 TIM barrel-domain containing protein [Dysgonamonadaceae bacterium]
MIVAQTTGMDLSGIWRFQIDRNDVGVQEKWFSKQLNDHIALPGSMNENRKGDDVTLHTQWTASIYDSSFFYNPRLEKYRDPNNLKLPFWLTPVKYYVGVAWYQKEVIIPSDWKGKRIILFLERPHIETRVWANNKEIGTQNSLSVPHIYDLTSYLKPGKNTLSVRVDNRIKDIDVGKDSHSITDQTQGNWNGIVGRIELQSTPKSYIDDIQVFPNVKNKKALVKLLLRGNSSGILTLEANSFNSDTLHSVVPVIRNYKIDKDSLRLDVELPMGEEMQTWDEFHPTLYRLKITMKSGKNETDVKETYFGMRDFTIKETYFYVNDRKIVLRGTVENCVFPLTGYPSMDVESWERIFRICRNFGLNHMRFHSYCPPQAAFTAADLVGFYLQPEGPTWPNHGSSLGDGRPVDKYLEEEEAKRIVKDYGNHPSFCMFAIGNEPRGRWVPWVSRFVDYWKSADPRRVYTGASVGNSWAWQPKSQFHVKAGARGLAWDRRPETNSDYLANIDTVKQPYVAHEMGQWCVFPDFTEIRKYTGVMKARNLELFQEDLFDRGMGTLAPDFLRASGKLQALCYKHEIEKMLRTPKYAGFQLLSLNDYPGQGTALVGVLNAFWEEKGYITAEEFRQFCAPTVLLSRMDKFVFKNNETFKARVEVAHFGEHPLKNMKAIWRIKDPYGKIISKGSLSEKDITIGNCQSLGEVSFPLHSLAKAQKLNFEVKFQGTDITNNWDFWVYPETLPEVDTSSIYICTQIDNAARSVLDKGGSVLLQLAGKVTQGSDVVQYMTPVFWNTSWFKMRPPHTVGTLINDFHPVFKYFPTDFYTGLQWWELIHKAQVMELTDFPKSFQPIVQPIDTWFINRKLGMLFESKAGNGKIVVCSADIQNNLEERPVARQLRYSILKYMNSHLFHPENDIDLSLIENLYTKQGERLEVTTQDAPDELKKNVK